MLGQPAGQRQQTGRGGVESANFGPDRASGGKANGGDHTVFVHIQPSTARIENVHDSLPCPCAADAGNPMSKTLNNALPSLAALGAIGGALGVPDPTNTRARWHHDDGRPLRRRPEDNTTSFIHSGSAIPVVTNTNRLMSRPVSESFSRAAARQPGAHPGQRKRRPG